MDTLIHDTLSAIQQKVTLSADDKAFIKNMSEQLGLAFTPRGNCKRCYQDQAVAIYKAIKEHDAEQPTSDHYQLRDGLDVIWSFNGMRINESTITDEVAAFILEHGFPRKFFKHIPE